MSKFIIVGRIDLSDIGEEETWKDCYMKLRDLTVEELQRVLPQIASSEDGSKEQVELILGLIERTFIEGKGYTASGIEDIQKEDIKDLPLVILSRCFDFFVRGRNTSSAMGKTAQD